MCGIAGVCDLRGAGVVDEGALLGMAESLVHRGPDAEGMYAAPGVGLAHRRLSIIDVAGGDQPMCNEDGTVWLVFNGEIYNHPELRAELLHKGHVFKTRSDTEVILHQYEEDGPDCVRRFRGMFAIALWDERRRRLVLTVDRFGKKPLFVAQAAGSLAFASEIKALLTLPWVDRAWDATALRGYLALGYVPGMRTAYRGIRRLAPGTVETWTLSEGHAGARTSSITYWRPTTRVRTPVPAFSQAKVRLAELLADSVRLRLRSDVPLGAFLSGGLDSTSVVALMRRCGVSDLKTFSIGFEGDQQSELPVAARTAALFGTEHRSHVVTSADAQELVGMLRGFDEPFADDSAIPTYFVSRLARQHVTVALSGDGGDELFAGYTQYRRIRRLAAIDRVPASVRVLLSRAGSKVVAREARGGRFVRDLGRSSGGRTLDMVVSDQVDLRPALCRGFRDFLDECGDDAVWQDGFAGDTSVAGMQEVDQRRYLADDILVKVDRCSMMVSLEVRAPLLDHRLAEFVNGLPTSYKLRGATTKRILRETVASLVPEAVLAAPKRGFGMPLRSWLKGPLRGFAEESLLDEGAQLFEPGAARALLDGDATHIENWERRTWTLLSLGAWASRQETRPW